MAHSFNRPFPEHIQLNQMERGNVARLGGPPPVRIVPEKSAKKGAEKTSTVTIKLTDEAKQTYTKFAGGTGEETLLHIHLF